MQRTLLLCALFAVGCDQAPTDPAADAGAPARAAAIADAGAPDAGPAPIEWEDCPWVSDAAPLESNRTGRCAQLELPLDHDAPGERVVSIDVRRLESPDPATVELILLNGGPGASAQVYERISLALSRSWRTVRMLLVDARGAGRSTRLGCPAEAVDSPGGGAIVEEEWESCLDALRARWGDGLRHFGTTAAARDLLEVTRRTHEPGVDQVVLGASYGTYWVQRALQIDPDAFDGVVLDSIVPADDPDLTYIGRWHDEVTRAYLSRCDEDAFCAERLGGDAVAATEDLLARVSAGHCAELEVEEPNLLLRVAFGALISSSLARAAIPALVHRVDRCTPEDVEAVRHLLGLIFGSGDEPSEAGLFSVVLAHHVTFSELWPDPPASLEELQSVADAAIAHKNIGPTFRMRYDDWPRYAPDAYHGRWPETDVPMLLLNGTLDPQTPIETARRAEAAYDGPHQRFVTMPDVAHATLTNSPIGGGATCGAVLLGQFLTDREAELDLGCLDELAVLDFRLEGTGYANALFGTTDLWD